MALKASRGRYSAPRAAPRGHISCWVGAQSTLGRALRAAAARKEQRSVQEALVLDQTWATATRF